MARTIKVGGKTHTITKDVVVKHKDGKVIDLTKVANVKTIAAGVKATKKYHSKKGK
jgi:hypothetical protein